MGKLLQFDSQRKRLEGTPAPGGAPAFEQGFQQEVLAANLIPFESALDEGSEASPTFSLFVKQVQSRSASTAGETLSFLLGVTQAEGVRCALAFAERLRRDQDLTRKAESLYGVIKENNDHECLLLLALCFDLQGSRAMSVLQHLQAQAS